MVKPSSITATMVCRANHDVHNGSQKNSMKKTPIHGFFVSCAIDVYYRAHPYVAGKYQSKTVETCLIMRAQPKIKAG